MNGDEEVTESKTDYILKKDGKVQLVPVTYTTVTRVGYEETSITGLEDCEFLTVDEIVEDIISNRLAAEDLEVIRTMVKKELITMHFSMGMWIRNTYGLWVETNPQTTRPETMTDEEFAKADIHPDQYSFSVIEKIYNKLDGSAAAFDRSMEIV